MDDVDDFAHCRRARPLHEPRRCVVLDAKGEGLHYCDTIDGALRAAKSIPRAHTIADVASGVVLAKYYGASRAIVRLPWEPHPVEEEPEPEEGAEPEEEED